MKDREIPVERDGNVEDGYVHQNQTNRIGLLVDKDDLINYQLIII